jgi:hypothetical protein
MPPVWQGDVAVVAGVALRPSPCASCSQAMKTPFVSFFNGIFYFFNMGWLINIATSAFHVGLPCQDGCQFVFNTNLVCIAKTWAKCGSILLSA